MTETKTTSTFLLVLFLVGWFLAVPGTATAHSSGDGVGDEILEVLDPEQARDLTAEQRERALENPLIQRLLRMRRVRAEAEQVIESAVRAVAESLEARDGPRAPETDEPGFETLAGRDAHGRETVDPRRGLSDRQLQKLLGDELFESLSPRKRNWIRKNDTLTKFYQSYLDGKTELERIRRLAASIIAVMKPPLITSKSIKLRDQLPIEGTHFVMKLPPVTAYLFIERNRSEKERDQQVANIYEALEDPDGDSRIKELFRLIRRPRKAGDGWKDKLDILLNLKPPHGGTVGMHSLFDTISLGLENPWLSTSIGTEMLRGVVCHELGHALQARLYGWKPSVSLVGRVIGLWHNPWVTTSNEVALSEGWADFCGVYFGKSTYWEWCECFRHEDGEDDKPLKSRADLMKTEGVVTRYLLLLTERIPDFIPRVLEVLRGHRPRSLQRLHDGLIRENPAHLRTLRGALDEVLAGAR